MPRRSAIAATTLAILLGAANAPVPVDWVMVAKIREEGLQHSQVMDYEAYMTDVLGARLTMSDGMKRAQQWVRGEMTRIGLVNVAAEPFMDFGVTWDNEFVSLHMLDPDYAPMVGYPLSHTPGTNGPLVLQAVIADVRVRGDLAKHHGTLKGKAVLMSPPATIDLARRGAGVARVTGLRSPALRQSARYRGGREAGLREALGVLQPGLRSRPVSRHLPAGK
jgi:hypothetical protein